MDKIVANDGGPAFPRTEDTINHRNKDWDLDGMSLRDYFAAKALSGMLAYPGGEGNGSFHSNSSIENNAVEAYKYADAMLKARSL